MNTPETTGINSRLSWASALMPIVIHELNNATQYLGMLHSVHAQDPSAGFLEKSTPDLVRTASSVEELGLMMAILSTAAGTDLLLDRRSDRSLSVAIDLTVKAVRKRGRDVALPENLSLIALSQTSQGWALPWAVGARHLPASEALPDGASLMVHFNESGWGARVGGGDGMRSHAALVTATLAEITSEVRGTEWSFSIPPGWISTTEPEES